ncbi:MAG: hypothetical protein U0Y10_09665 [Spirosomataceae bacterium]
MKKLFFILLSFATTISYSQKKIEFTLESNQIKTTDGLTKLRLPLELVFTQNFKDLAISILNSSNEVIALKDGKFGAGELTLLEEPPGKMSFNIQIDDKGQVNPISVGDKKIIEEKIKLKIGNTNPIELAFDENPPPPINDDEDKTKSNDKYQPGFIYYDAIKIANENESVVMRLNILEAYGINMENADKNPYISKIYKDLKAKPAAQLGLNFSSPVSNTDVTNFAVGLARFLAERTKEELNEAFFSKMKEQLNAYPELKTVFPNTTTILNAIETYSYASIIQVLKEAFETDVQNLPENLYNIKSLTDGDCDKVKLSKKDSTSCHERLKKLTDFFATQDGHWVALGMYSVKEGLQSTNPADLLKSIVLSTEFTKLKTVSSANSEFADYNIVSSIELSNFISQSLISKDEKQIWVTTTQLNALFKTKDAFKIYLGLLLAKELKEDTKIEFYNSSSALVSFEKILSDNYSTYGQFESLIKNIYSAYNATNNAVKKMIAASEKSVVADPQALYDYYRTLTSSLKPVAYNPLLIALVGKAISASYDKVEQFLNPSVDIAYHIATKKYSAAIYDASILLSAVNEFKVTTKGKTKEEKYDGFKTVTKSFVKYGTLISTVANAQSSDEVKQALEASVLPVGSSVIKRKSAWSISVNGYVGGFYGKAHSSIQETQKNTATNKVDTITKAISYRTYGLYAPIGLSFNRGFKCGWGVSLSAQILDLGALVNFYLTEGDKTALPSDFKVKLSDILSPGAQLGINIPKTPLTLMGGIQYVPALNSTSQISSKSEMLSPVAWRCQISLVVDIPLYNLKVWDFRK